MAKKRGPKLRRRVEGQGQAGAPGTSRYQEPPEDAPTYTTADTTWPAPASPAERLSFTGSAGAPLTDALGTTFDGPADRVDMADVLRQTATEPGYAGIGLGGPSGGLNTSGGAPDVRTAADVADLRNWLVRQWQPGGLYCRATERAERTSGDEAARQRFVDGERSQLQRADLYWVHPNMVDLLETVAPSTPGDVKPTDLHWPAHQGFVVFARPLRGIDAMNGEHLKAFAAQGDNRDLTLGHLEGERAFIEVNAIVWSNVRIPDPKAKGGASYCLGVSSYRLLDFGAGLSPQETALAMGTGAIDGGTGKPVGVREDTGDKAFSLSGTVWAPMGRSDWPIDSELDDRQYWIPEDAWPSFREDRQTIASLFTLLEQRQLVTSEPGATQRASKRRAERLGVERPYRNVVVVTLRQPRHHHAANPDSVQPVKRTHRWLVREHLRWQACGPGRAERRLTVVRAHWRGPEDAPLVLKTRVNAWVR